MDSINFGSPTRIIAYKNIKKENQDGPSLIN
jgi:hypothetical protein